MPRIKTNRTRKAPDGFDKIEETLREFEIQLKEIQNKKTSKLSANSKENEWEIMRINNERSRYVYSLFYKRKAISRDLYEWLLKEKYADKYLIAKWKRKGYEKLCCIRCIQTDETIQGKTCICRVPRIQLENESSRQENKVTFQQCVHCGCSGCSSTD
ncbi:hypothetical protein Kpol_1028p48 [Vanderwaltozyma polyspora DSM 70294]|uniref:Pre-mRNA-splicing factor BUD31 n=1 Tax=Vanderwaltozyma polyspora (strain ATCC 22028 / DSM 70294 / BCRC 21397 / CBS 2163 / NBRC 10782 / NRRL Y-8283 / UCD 57-17) TaxID=436907 RepID=A7TG16_VANPO|nr:uncharacterized protein Kpol_1028p48 [Vanderwaltozyma polyspora DSM 70294]EDO18773.1 hypothetical protein Kpol_1028p48 [Vanderwaltozyma polyspora DSM 70294]